MSDFDPTVPDSDATLPTDSDATIASSADRSPVPEAALPAGVGHYRPLRVLGQGGMGVVYAAEQERPRRLVALKVIRPEMATEDLRRRFAHESDFLGRLQHPGIAQIYEAGTAETEQGPVPFMAMELVEGLPLHRWVEEKRPDRRARLELMIRLCEAVQHAHQRGIIHRDLKPGNVMVDREGRPKILDFGVARPTATDFMSTLLTTHGQLVGTVAYMSPEQLAGDPEDLDTRSDVFALGVILYQLLAGRPPLELVGRPLEEALRAIREEEPAPLSRHDPALEGDLTIIAATAMAKDRTERYASANGLAMDLRRHLDDEPIAARPPSTAYLMRKFARRHRPLVMGVVGVAAALVLGIAVSTWQAVRATRAEALATARLAQAETVTEFLQDMLAAVQPFEARGREVTVSEVLDRAAADLDAGALGDQPTVEAALRRTLGNTYTTLARLEEGERQLARSLALADSVLGADDPARQGVRVELANTLQMRGRYERTEQLMGSFVRKLPEDPETAANALEALAGLRYSQGLWAEADSLQGLKQDLVLAAGDPDSLALGRTLLDRAFLAEQQRNFALATARARRAGDIYLAAFGPADPRMIKVHNKLGDIARSEGRYREALEFHRQAFAVADSIYADDHLTRADILWRMGDAYRYLRRLDEAGDAYEQTLAIRRAATGPVHRDIALVLSSLGSLAMMQGDFDRAESSFQEALAMRREIFGGEHAGVIASLQDLGNMERNRKRFAEALRYFEEAEDLLARLPQATGSQPADNAFYMGMVHQMMGDHAEAERHFRRELTWNSEHFPSPHVKIAYALGNVGGSLFRQDRKSEAADLLVQALAMFRELGVQGAGLMQAIGNAAFLLDDAGRYQEAETLHREYIALAEETSGAADPGPTDARARFFENLAGQNKWAEAEEQARAIVAWRREHLPAEDWKRDSGLLFLARAQLGLDRRGEAEATFRQAAGGLEGRADLPDQVTARLQEMRTELNVAR